MLKRIFFLMLYNHQVVMFFSWVDQVSGSFSNWADGFPVNDSELPWKCGYLEHNGETHEILTGAFDFNIHET